MVERAHARAEAAGFPLSCETVAGSMLSTLAAAVPRGGRILELGTGAGVSLGWIVSGLGTRSDAEVVTVELDPAMQQIARDEAWPPWVRFELGDGAALVSRLGDFDLIFADAPGGKLENLDGALAALRPGGLFLVDDMDLARHGDAKLRTALRVVRERLVADPELVTVELAAGSGLVLCARR